MPAETAGAVPRACLGPGWWPCETVRCMPTSHPGRPGVMEPGLEPGGPPRQMIAGRSFVRESPQPSSGVRAAARRADHGACSSPETSRRRDARRVPGSAPRSTRRWLAANVAVGDCQRGGSGAARAHIARSPAPVSTCRVRRAGWCRARCARRGCGGPRHPACVRAAVVVRQPRVEQLNWGSVRWPEPMRR